MEKSADMFGCVGKVDRQAETGGGGGRMPTQRIAWSVLLGKVTGQGVQASLF